MSARLRMTTVILMLMLPIAFLGCSGDGATVPSGDDGTLTGLAQGEADADLGSFQLRTNAGPDPDRPMPGPFLIMGQNIAWVDSMTALCADILVQNISGNTYAEPVTLTFTSLRPDSVRVVDGEGTELDMLTFEFANDDAMWTDGETSLPYRIYFTNIEQGQAVAFTARIDVGMLPGKGSIGGVVFDDQNENGIRDEDEMGVGGAGVALGGEGLEPMRMRTARDGSYRFDGLEAGFYTVMKLPGDMMRPTTDPQIQVLLSLDGEGGVSSYLEADFGCFVVTPPDTMPPLVMVGDCVQVTGKLARDPWRVLAFGIDHEGDREDEYPDPRKHDEDHDGDHDWDDDDWDDEDDCSFGELRGTVTDINLDENMLAVLGTWVHLGDDASIDPVKDDDDGDDEDGDDRDHPCKDLTLADLKIGDRVRVRTTTASDPGDEEMIQGYRLRCWNNRWDKVKGIVETVETDADGHVTSFTILRTTIVPMRKDQM